VKRLSLLLTVCLIVFAGFNTVEQAVDRFFYKRISRAQEIDPARVDALQWIRMHTPRQAVLYPFTHTS
jgi:hypothetical protein